MLNVRSLNEWCNTDPSRKNSQQECEAAYVLADDGLFYACEYNHAAGKCEMAASGEDCSTSCKK